MVESQFILGLLLHIRGGCSLTILLSSGNNNPKMNCDSTIGQRLVRDGSLITCGEGVEDILTYLMEFSSPPSQIYVDILIPTPGLQKKLHNPSLEMLFTFHPPAL